MKYLIILFLAIQACFAQEAYFFTMDAKHPTLSIKGDNMIASFPIKKVAPPKAISILAYHQGFGDNRDYQIQIDLSNEPQKGWIPKLKLGNDILVEGVSVSRPEGESFRSSFSLESSDKDKILNWVALLSKLLNVPKQQIHIDLKPIKMENKS